LNSKKAITLLVLTTMLLAMVPMVPVANAVLIKTNIDITNDSKSGLTDSGEKGNTIILEGDAGSVASGYEVLIYWDKIQDWDGAKGHRNTTEVDNDGGFEIWFTVPEAPQGSHYIWVTATDQETKVSLTFTVISDCDISTSSGLAESKILVDLWGYAKDKEVAILFMDDTGYLTDNQYAEYNAEAAVDLYESGEDKYDGTLDENMIQPGTLGWNIEKMGTLVEGGGTAEWVTTPTKSGDFSVELEVDCTTTPDSYSALSIPYDIPFDDIVIGTTTFYYQTSVGDTYAPHICFYLTDGTYTADITMMTNTVLSPSAWASPDLSTVSFHYYGDIPALSGETQGPGGAQLLSYWQTKVPTTYDVFKIQVEEGWWSSGTGNAYVDDFTINGDLVENFITDSSDGNVRYCGDDVGNINYVSGEWSLDLGDVPDIDDGAEMDVSYKYIDDETDKLYVLTSAGQTNSLGTWEDKRITIPAVDPDTYYVVGFDGKNNQASAAFTIGSVITISDDEGDVGDKITVEGEGFTDTAGITLTAWIIRGTDEEQCHIIGADDGDDETDDDGEFEFDIIIPQVKKKDDDYEICVREDGSSKEALTDFEVTGLASVSVDPEFGPQGSSVKVSGKNFQNIKDSKVKITLMSIPEAEMKDEVKLDSDGSFEVTCTVPTENDASYDIKVEDIDDDDGHFYISDTVEFRIGTIMVLLSKGESVVGDKIVFTGNGFTKSKEWNATFGDVVIFEEETTSATGLLRVSGDETPQFFVPQVQPGEYTILVWDVEAEISVETDFTVTEYTVLDFELLEAPNDFNVSIEGWNWPEVCDINDVDEIEFVLWNETKDWEMNVLQVKTKPDKTTTPITPRVTKAAELNGTGFLNYAWWVVPDDNTLDMGSYWINATIETETDQKYLMQLEFIIGDIHEYISPRKATFRVGDTVSFNIQHTFGNDKGQDIYEGDVKVYDPDGTLYWDGDKLGTWSKVETWYESPYSDQTASDNPMLLLDDAPLGTWTYKWRDKTGEVIEEGTFNVEASEAEVLTDQINDINQAIDDLTRDITGVTDAIAGVQTNINSAIQAANAAVDAANAAVEAVNAVAGVAGGAAEAADRAAEAAGKAQDAAGNLSTLVYGAIGASLVAALAAIVSLMQISKRIAG